MTKTELIKTLARVIYGNDLHSRHGEDTIGVLMKYGVFHDAEVVSIAIVVDKAADDLGLKK